MNLRKRTFEIVEAARSGDRASSAFDIFIVSLIAINVASFVLETVEPIHDAAPMAFFVIEVVSVAVFSVEYVLRLWSCTAGGASPVMGRVRFAARPLLLLDLAAILPFYLPFLGLDLRVLRVLRVLRLARLAKLARYSRALQLLGRAILRSGPELVLSVALMGLLLLIASAIMYYAERDAQPQAFASVPRSMWWAVATLTTVGYGDVYPVTAFGRIIGSVISILGIGMFALPTAILGAAFVEEVRTSRLARDDHGVCSRCGRPFD